MGPPSPRRLNACIPARRPGHMVADAPGDSRPTPLRAAAARAPRIKPMQDRRDKPQPVRWGVPLLARQQAFGYTQEDVKFLMTPMAANGEEAIGSMGNDSPLAALSGKKKTLYHYFKQLFAQVTN